MTSEGILEDILSLCVQAQMVRRVKAYLKTMKVITNEEELHKMSQECEPPLGGLPPPPPPITMVGMGEGGGGSEILDYSTHPFHSLFHD